MHIGKLKLAMALTAIATASGLSLQAQETRAEAAAHLRKVEPKEMDPNYKGNAGFAQKLVDGALARHAEVLLLAIHGGAPKYDIIASNFGRIGKLGDEDDLRCIRTGKDNLEVSKEGNHFEVEMPLKSKTGKTVGALAVVFAYKAGDDKSALQKLAHELENEMQEQITAPARLFAPA